MSNNENYPINLVFVQDVVECLIKLVEDESRTYGVYNICSDESITINKLIDHKAEENVWSEPVLFTDSLPEKENNYYPMVLNIPKIPLLLVEFYNRDRDFFFRPYIHDSLIINNVQQILYHLQQKNDH